MKKLQTTEMKSTTWWDGYWGWGWDQDGDQDGYWGWGWGWDGYWDRGWGTGQDQDLRVNWLKFKICVSVWIPGQNVNYPIEQLKTKL